MKSTVLLILCLTLVSAQGCHAKQGTFQPPTIIPFKLVDNRPFVEVEVNGTKGIFIVDTGGRHGFNTDFVKTANIIKTDSFRISGAGNGSQWASYGETTKLTLAGTEVISTSERPIILNLNMIRDSLNLPFLDGVIGEELFHSYNVSINYPDRLIKLYKGAYPTDEYKMIPFSFFRNQIPMISMEVDGISGDFTIDTGDRSTLTVFPEFYDQHMSEKNYDLSELKKTGYGVGGPVLAREFNLKEVIIGDQERFISVKTRVPDHTAGAWANNDHAGNIGSALLRDYEVIFDYSKRQILIKKVPALSIPVFTYHASNLDSTADWYEKHFPFERTSSSDTSITLQYQHAKIRFVKADKLPPLREYKAQRDNKEPNGVFKFGFDIQNTQKLYDELLPKPDVLLMGRLINFWGTNMFLVRDPEGNVVQFFEGGSTWRNTFYALITNSELEFQNFLRQMTTLRMIEESNFNNDSSGVKQQNFARGYIKIELLKLDMRAEEAYNGLGASGIQLKSALSSVKLDSSIPLRHHAAATFTSNGIGIFGGTSAHDPIGLNDTWRLSEKNNWSQITAPELPPARSSLMLFTEPKTENIYLLGGWDNNQVLSDFWKLEDGQWKLLSNETPLGKRYSSGYTYHKKAGYHVFYGGCAENRQNLADTWIFKDDEWQLINKESAPGERCRPQMAYDEANQKPLLFGGSGGSEATWLFQDKQWTQVADTGPPARYNHMITSDIKRKKVILFGGAAPEGIRFNDLWEWDGKKWQKIEFSQGPAPRDMGMMVYNDNDGLVYLVGGRTPAWEPINDLWTWNGQVWNRIY